MGFRLPLNRLDSLRILGLAHGCSESEMRQAYRDLVQIWHPDRFTDQRLKQRAEEALKRINEAYAVLTSRLPTEDAPHGGTTFDPDDNFSGTFSPRTKPAETAARKCTARPRVDRRWPPLRWLSGLKVVLLATLGVIPLILGWYIYNAIRPSVLALDSALSGGARRLSGQSRLLHPSLAVNPVADLASAAENLQTWALMRWLELRPTKFVAIATEPVSAERRAPRISARLRPESSIRPSTGNLIHPGPPYGAGQLEVANLTTLDAAFQFMALDRPRRSPRLVYLRAGESFAIRDLAPQQYIMTVELGKGWLARRAVFAASRQQVAPIGPFSFVQFQNAKQTWSDLFRVEIKNDGRP